MRRKNEALGSVSSGLQHDQRTSTGKRGNSDAKAAKPVGEQLFFARM
jgi:hypothetical protein